MRKYLLSIIGLVLLLMLAFPTAAMAADVPLHNPGPDYETDGEWHFVITGLDSESEAPDTIHIVWSDGSEDDIPLDTFTGHTAHYSYPNTKGDVYPTGGTAVIDQEGWKGNFNLSHGPTVPIPELPVAALFGTGLAGLGAFVFFKRKAILNKI